MLSPVIWFALCCIGYFFCKYSYDDVSFAKGKVENLSPPSVSDLRVGTSLHNVDKYVDCEVVPLKDFSVYEKAISRIAPDKTAALYIQLFICGVPFALCIKSLCYLFTKLSFAENRVFLCWILATLIVILCFVSARFIIKKLYISFLKIPAFQLSPDELEEQFTQTLISFPISRRRAFENYVISKYLLYYEQYFPSLSRRHSLSKIIDIVLIIVYILFYFEVP